MDKKKAIQDKANMNKFKKESEIREGELRAEIADLLKKLNKFNKNNNISLSELLKSDTGRANEAIKILKNATDGTWDIIYKNLIKNNGYVTEKVWQDIKEKKILQEKKKNQEECNTKEYILNYLHALAVSGLSENGLQTFVQTMKNTEKKMNPNGMFIVFYIIFYYFILFFIILYYFVLFLQK